MFTPIREGVFRWSTPDPADDWMMVGHLLVRETGVVLVDPPMVPGLLEAAGRLGNLEAVLLTEQNHTRASRFIAKRAGIPVYLPETIPEAVEPSEAVKVKEIGDFEVYKTGSVRGREADNGLDAILVLFVRFLELFRRYSRAYRITQDPVEPFLDLCKVFEAHSEVVDVGVDRAEESLVAQHNIPVEFADILWGRC